MRETNWKKKFQATLNKDNLHAATKTSFRVTLKFPRDSALVKIKVTNQ